MTGAPPHGPFNTAGGVEVVPFQAVDAAASGSLSTQRPETPAPGFRLQIQVSSEVVRPERD